jgi:hypothetical protein
MLDKLYFKINEKRRLFFKNCKKFEKNVFHREQVQSVNWSRFKFFFVFLLLALILKKPLFAAVNKIRLFSWC